MQTLGFGVTKRAALPNTAAVCGRSTFHSEQRCTEQLCRQVAKQSKNKLRKTFRCFFLFRSAGSSTR